MNAFSDQNELYGVLKSLFKEVEKQPSLVHDFVHSNLVVRVLVENPEAEILLDGRQPPLGVFFGPSPGEANFQLSVQSDLLHQIWSSQLSMMKALFSGQIQTKGNVIRAQPFLELLDSCGPIYRNIRRTNEKR